MEWNDTYTPRYIENYGEHKSNDIAFKCAQLKAKERLLDIGCGSGRILRLAMIIPRLGAIVGCDPSFAMVEHAKDQMAKGQMPPHSEQTQTKWPALLCARGENLPFKAEHFHCVISANTHHFWSDWDQVLRQIWRVLRPGGRLVLIEDDWRKDNHEDFDPDTLLPQDIFKNALKRNGFPAPKLTLELHHDLRAAVVVVQKNG